jgi:hypothetical protein
MTPQLLNDEQYKINIKSAMTLQYKSAMTPQLLNDEQYKNK